MNEEKVAKLIHELLLEIGEDPEREGLIKTPLRAARAWDFLSKGYGESMDDIVNQAVFKAECSNMIIVRDIEVYSLCEHHMLPFYGRAHIGYIPRDKVLVVSKLARLTD